MSIKERRVEKGLKQGDVAVALGVTQGAVSQWESGVSNPSIDLLVKLARLFGCTVDDLLQEDSDCDDQTNTTEYNKNLPR